MNIHKTKIEWCSHTWNPVTGCRHDCPYCYARRIATRFGPKIDEFPDESGITAFINEGVDCYVVEKPTELKDWQGNYRRSTPYPKNFAPTLHKYTLIPGEAPHPRRHLRRQHGRPVRALGAGRLDRAGL